jgi:hypothetical protein
MRERATKRLERPREFRIVGELASAMNKVSFRDIHESGPINFDDLTYAGDEIHGTEPHEG